MIALEDADPRLGPASIVIFIYLFIYFLFQGPIGLHGFTTLLLPVRICRRTCRADEMDR